MRYDDALAIGTVVEGIIKCTWAMVYDENGNKLFALQAHRYQVAAAGVTVDYLGDKIATGEKIDTDNLYLTTTDSGISEAVVCANKYVYAYKVPVILTSQVADFLNMCIKQLQCQIEDCQKILRIYSEDITNLEAAFIEDVPGSIQEKYEAALNRKQAVEKRIAELVAKQNNRKSQLERVKAGGYFYVKPKAFEWFPVNSNNITSDLQKKKQAYDTAKKILAVSAATIVI